jgi:FKBP-type peptidyl-prolyl cis-trans isomerase 2
MIGGMSLGDNAIWNGLERGSLGFERGQKHGFFVQITEANAQYKANKNPTMTPKLSLARKRVEG